jgi:hypothetical protein
LDKLIDNAQQKHADGNGIDDMHYLKVETGRPVRVFFSEEIHIAKLTKKRKLRVIRSFRLIILF